MKSLFPFVDIYLTRECNLRCSYCSVYKETKSTLDAVTWKEVFTWLKGKTRTVSMFGGEPTIHPDFEYIIRALNELDMNHVICSNCSIPPKTLKKYAEIPVKTFGGSIDSLQDNFPDKWSRIKSHNALKVLPIFQENGSNIILNFMACKTNWFELPTMTTYCRERGWHICFNLFHVQKGGIFAGGGSPLALNKPELEKLSKMLVEEKKKDDTILGTIEFFQNLPKFGLYQNWHCNNYVTLMIDSDGQLLVCREYAGEKTSQYSIFDLITGDLSPMEYKKIVAEDAKKCHGCLHEIHYTSLMVEKGLIDEEVIF